MSFWMLGLALLAALFLGMQVMMILRARTRRGKAVPTLPGAYGEALRGGGRALFYFSSPGCSMCRPMEPIVARLAADFPRVFKVDILAEPEAARAFGIMATPTTLLVEGGIIARFLLGFQAEEKLRRWLAA